MPNEYFQFLDAESLSRDLRIDINNTSGVTLVSSIYDRENSFEFADEYTITVNSINLITNKIAVSVSATTLNNPYIDTNIPDLIADNATYHYDVLPGIGIMFGTAASLSVGNICIVTIGYGLVDGTITAGSDSDKYDTRIRLAVRNEYDSELSNCKVRVIAKPLPENVNGSPIIAAYCTYLWDAENRTELTIRFVDFIEGSNQVCQIDGGDDVEIICDSTSGNELLPGLFVVFDDAAAISSLDVASIIISDGHRHVELAPDSDGFPGTWVTFGSTVTLTQDGLASGVINDGEIAYFWKQLAPGSSVDPAGNPREYVLLVEGDITS
jgi:hypothetical protein